MIFVNLRLHRAENLQTVPVPVLGLQDSAPDHVKKIILRTKSKSSQIPCL
jgi:hypothetical protein